MGWYTGLRWEGKLGIGFAFDQAARALQTRHPAGQQLLPGVQTRKQPVHHTLLLPVLWKIYLARGREKRKEPLCGPGERSRLCCWGGSGKVPGLKRLSQNLVSQPDKRNQNHTKIKVNKNGIFFYSSYAFRKVPESNPHVIQVRIPSFPLIQSFSFRWGSFM